MSFADLELTRESATQCCSAPEVRRLLSLGTSLTRAGGQHDVSCNKLPQMNVLKITIYVQ